MKLRWYGQASFRITASDGTRIVTDPFTSETAGYPPVTEPADLVIISSDNDSFHCRADLIPGNPTVVNALALAQSSGETTERGIPIRAIQAMEALNHRYHDPDQNGMYRFVVDGLHIGHMGDVGNALSEAQIAFFEGVDVLLALTGGHPTIELDDLMALINTVRPPLVVPMHFQTLSLKPHNLYWPDQFNRYFPREDVSLACANEVEITRDSLPEATKVLYVDYVR
jgi:L-ascorbate metabolism protein UlaG (beta-lactamase superfamily)